MSLALGLFALLQLAAVPAAPSGGAVDPAAQAALDRTRQTHATYSLYGWNRVKTSDGSEHREWGAEFHRGSLHRVETPRIRLVADCAAGTGTVFDGRTGETRSGPDVARAGCGIDANRPVLTLELVRRADSRFGPADTLRLFDDENERIYVIDADGVLLAAEYFSTQEGNPSCLQSEAIAVERSVPEGDIFSAASLTRSIVHPRYRAPPEGASDNLWLGDRRCLEEP